jgi:DNA-binding response OmpR family regulator
MQRVLVVEDEARIAMSVQRALSACGYQVEWARDGHRALAELSHGSYDVTLLDLILPGPIDGFRLLGEIAALRSNHKVIVLSALSDVESKVRCFEAGASDYLTKPFVIAELVARIRARVSLENNRPSRYLEDDGVRLDRHRRVVMSNGSTIALSPKEFLLLEYLMRKQGEVCSRPELLQEIWGYHFDPGTNVLDVYVRRVRRKVGRDLIETIRNVGYRYAASDSP